MAFKTVFARSFSNIIKPYYGTTSRCLNSAIVNCNHFEISKRTFYGTSYNCSPSRSYQEVVVDTSESEKAISKELFDKVNNEIKAKEQGRLFAVVHVCGKQFKITPEDIFIVEGTWPPTVDDEIVLEKVLLVGGANFSLIGRPVLPDGLVTVKAKIIEKDLSHTKINFRFLRRKRNRRTRFIRNEMTMLRITDISISPKVNQVNDIETVQGVF